MSISRGRVEACQSASRLAREMIGLSGAGRGDRITIVGCGEIELLTALAGQGFVDVTCRAAEGGPNAGDDPPDLVIAPAIRSEAELAAVLSRTGRRLRPGGTLLLALADLHAAHWRQRPAELLSRSGFTFVRKQSASAGGDVLCFRKLPALQIRAA